MKTLLQQRIEEVFPQFRNRVVIRSRETKDFVDPDHKVDRMIPPSYYILKDELLTYDSYVNILKKQSNTTIGQKNTIGKYAPNLPVKCSPDSPNYNQYLAYIEERIQFTKETDPYPIRGLDFHAGTSQESWERPRLALDTKIDDELGIVPGDIPYSRFSLECPFPRLLGARRKNESRNEGCNRLNIVTPSIMDSYDGNYPYVSLILRDESGEIIKSPMRKYMNLRTINMPYTTSRGSTYEDGCIISPNCAEEYEIEIGDKIVDRHGNKYTVSDISELSFEVIDGDFKEIIDFDVIVNPNVNKRKCYSYLYELQISWEKYKEEYKNEILEGVEINSLIDNADINCKGIGIIAFAKNKHVSRKELSYNPVQLTEPGIMRLILDDAEGLVTRRLSNNSYNRAKTILKACGFELEGNEIKECLPFSTTPLGKRITNSLDEQFLTTFNKSDLTSENVKGTILDPEITGLINPNQWCHIKYDGKYINIPVDIPIPVGNNKIILSQFQRTANILVQELNNYTKVKNQQGKERTDQYAQDYYHKWLSEVRGFSLDKYTDIIRELTKEYCDDYDKVMDMITSKSTRTIVKAIVSMNAKEKQKLIGLFGKTMLKKWLERSERNKPKKLERMQEELFKVVSNKKGALRNIWNVKFRKSVRGVMTGDPSLRVDQISIPMKVKEKINSYSDICIAMRYPIHNQSSMMSFEVVYHEGNSIKINPAVVQLFAGDFDGDCLSIIFPENHADVVDMQKITIDKVISNTDLFHPSKELSGIENENWNNLQELTDLIRDRLLNTSCTNNMAINILDERTYDEIQIDSYMAAKDFFEIKQGTANAGTIGNRLFDHAKNKTDIENAMVVYRVLTDVTLGSKRGKQIGHDLIARALWDPIAFKRVTCHEWVEDSAYRTWKKEKKPGVLDGYLGMLIKIASKD